MSEAVEQARAVIEGRLAELRAEERRLTRALSALKGGDLRKRDGQKRGRGASEAAETTVRRRAPRGQRRTQFLAALTREPETPVAQIAKQLGVRPQQLYTLARKLVADGTIEKRNGGYVVVAARNRQDSAGG